MFNLDTFSSRAKQQRRTFKDKVSNTSKATKPKKMPIANKYVPKTPANNISNSKNFPRKGEKSNMNSTLSVDPKHRVRERSTAVSKFKEFLHF